MAPSSIYLKWWLLLYRNNCKGRFACVQYGSKNRFYMDNASTWTYECWHVVLLLSFLLKVKTELFMTEMSQTKS